MKNKILLVDDSNFFLEVEKDFFNRTECEIFTANSGEKALELMRLKKPDLVLMDLYMHEMKGDECCRIIKSDPALKGIPVIIVTHSISSEDRKSCIEAGCDDYVVKPINKTSILEKVSAYVGLNVREYEKAPISAEIIYAIGNEPHKGYAYVISEDDMYMKGDKMLPVGKVMNIIFSIAGIDEDIEAECEVVWTTEGRDDLDPRIAPGMLVKFTRISSEDRAAIAKYVDLVGAIFRK